MEVGGVVVHDDVDEGRRGASEDPHDVRVAHAAHQLDLVHVERDGLLHGSVEGGEKGEERGKKERGEGEEGRRGEKEVWETYCKFLCIHLIATALSRHLPFTTSPNDPE